MDRKSDIKDVYKSISQDIPEVYKMLCERLGDYNPFARFSIGAGHYVWEDDRYDWHRMIDASEMQQAAVRETLAEVKANVASKVGERTADVLFTTPDDSYIYYCNDGNGDVRVLITGWGFKKPVRNTGRGGELDLIKKENPVSVSFLIDGERLPDYAFGLRLAKQVKTLRTDSDGVYHFRDLKVGEHFTVTDIQTGIDYNLDIEEDKHDYEYDLTHYATLRVQATADGAPLADEAVWVEYHGKTFEARTNQAGQVELRMGIHPGEMAVGRMRGLYQEAEITEDGALMTFAFDTEQTPMVAPHILVKRESGELAPEYPINVEYEGEMRSYVTDANGCVALPSMEAGRSMTVKDACHVANTQDYILSSEQDEYIFVVPDETIEKKELTFIFRDVKGEPIACDNVKFSQDQHHDLIMPLDEEGKTEIDAQAFQPKTPMRASINGWERSKDYGSVPFTLDENENVYLIQEDEPKSSAWDIWKQILVVIGAVLILLLVWYLCSHLFEGLFHAIYHI